MNVESILRMNEFKSIKNKKFLKIMFCNGLICLKTRKKLKLYPIPLDEIILVT